ncbi:MAG: U32 family peptidase [Lachnospiraceae bacterium]|nr:U32 family peptidase [Lachnospiraceae bacterium]
MDRKLEVLAPAGSFESLKAAVMAGADAVYMGGSRFGARAYADNPEGNRLLEAVDYAHLYGVKLYLTINTLLKEQELLEELYDYLLPCYEHGLDAVIVQDMGVMQAVREWFPNLPVHASTQMTLCGSGGVRLLKEA